MWLATLATQTLVKACKQQLCILTAPDLKADMLKTRYSASLNGEQGYSK